MERFSTVQRAFPKTLEPLRAGSATELQPLGKERAGSGQQALCPVASVWCGHFGWWGADAPPPVMQLAPAARRSMAPRLVASPGCLKAGRDRTRVTSWRLPFCDARTAVGSKADGIRSLVRSAHATCHREEDGSPILLAAGGCRSCCLGTPLGLPAQV